MALQVGKPTVGQPIIIRGYCIGGGIIGAFFRACACGEGMRASWACPLLRVVRPHDTRLRLQACTLTHTHTNHTGASPWGREAERDRSDRMRPRIPSPTPQKQGSSARKQFAGHWIWVSQIRRLHSVFDPQIAIRFDQAARCQRAACLIVGENVNGVPDGNQPIKTSLNRLPIVEHLIPT